MSPCFTRQMATTLICHGYDTKNVHMYFPLGQLLQNIHKQTFVQALASLFLAFDIHTHNPNSKPRAMAQAISFLPRLLEVLASRPSQNIDCS